MPSLRQSEYLELNLDLPSQRRIFGSNEPRPLLVYILVTMMIRSGWLIELISLLLPIGHEP